MLDQVAVPHIQASLQRGVEADARVGSGQHNDCVHGHRTHTGRARHRELAVEVGVCHRRGRLCEDRWVDGVQRQRKAAEELCFVLLFIVFCERDDDVKQIETAEAAQV